MQTLSEKRRQAAIKRNTTHGMSRDPAYSNWKDMLKRCFNPNNKRYKHYAERGISVHPDFVTSFPKFLEEIGQKPEGRGWSVGRIDNNGWYTYGNIRWEQPPQQARNHSKQVNNSSGVTGVSVRSRDIAGNTYTTVIVKWNDLAGRRHTKDFSADKYGYDIAFAMAMKYRQDRIAELNALGADYADSHGADK